MRLTTGQMLQNRYRIVSLLGQGGMGAVYRAWDTRLDIPVALKEMIPQPNLDPRSLAQLRQQFQQEARTLARLNHPHLVDVTDFFEEQGRGYLVMKFIEGENLADRIEREGAIEESQVLDWADQLLDALTYCHSQGVIHRDLKPQNVIIRADGRAILVDFGLVKLWDPHDPRTRTAMRGMGTPEYAPPEQYDIDAGHTDARSDIYSLGATLYHALTGQAPPTATQRIASRNAFQRPRSLNQRVSTTSEEAVLRSLELTIEDRFATAQEMRSALRGQVSASPPMTLVSRPQATKVMPEARRAVGMAPSEGTGRAIGMAPSEGEGRAIRMAPSEGGGADAVPRKRLPAWVWAAGGLGLLLLGIAIAGVLIGGWLGQQEADQVGPQDTSSGTEVSAEATGTPDPVRTGTASPLLPLVPREVPPQCDYHAYRMGWLLDYGDAESIVNTVFHPDSALQYTFWDQQNFRDLVDEALMELDPHARAALWQQAEGILTTDYAVIIPIYHYDRTGLVRPELKTEFPPFGAPCLMKWQLPEGQPTLRIRLENEPHTLDPQIATDTDARYVVDQVMEGLYRYTGEGAIEPAGAKSYEVSEDGKVYTIHLRRNATWSDMEKVVAQHYVDGFIRLLDPRTESEHAWILYPIQGAEAYNAGETDSPSTVGVRAIDDYTLQITLEQPASHFDSILAFFPTYPARLDVIEEHGERWTEPDNFVGNGPYMLAEWAHDDKLVIKKNPIYHSAHAVNVRQVEFSIIPDDAVALAAYEESKLDVSGYPGQELSRILDEMEDHLVRLPRPGLYYLGLNTGLEPTSNLNLRKAMASSIDRRTILEEVLGMPWRTEACGAIPPEIPSHQGCGNVGYSFNLEAARRYLEAALEEMDIENPGDITLNLWLNQGTEDLGEAVAEQWERNLGINVRTSVVEWSDYVETLGGCGGDRQ